MSSTEARSKAAELERCAGFLRRLRVRTDVPWREYYVPGRVEFLGKHTDYAGGRGLLCAIERGFMVVAVPRGDTRVHLVDAAHDTPVTFQIDADLTPAPGHWSHYPMMVARRVARDFHGASTGVDAAFVSDLPQAAGMSSSSALVTAVFTVLADVNRLDTRPEYVANIRSHEDLAGYLGCIENGQTFGTLAGDRGVGTFGGSEDHTAILCARPGELVQYSFCPVRLERRLPLPPNHSLIIAVSGVIANKTGEAQDRFNRISRAAAAILRIWHTASCRGDATLAAAVESAPGVADRIREALRQADGAEFTTGELLDRFDQFVDESTRIIPAVSDALAFGSLATIGPLVDQSQAGAERSLGNQVPETIGLARGARALGAVAASAFGAGFGGSVWALVRTDQAEQFTARWAKAYRKQFPSAAERALFFSTRSGPPLTRISQDARPLS
jgi:galactokinase